MDQGPSRALHHLSRPLNRVWRTGNCPDSVQIDSHSVASLLWPSKAAPDWCNLWQRVKVQRWIGQIALLETWTGRSGRSNYWLIDCRLIRSRIGGGLVMCPLLIPPENRVHCEGNEAIWHWIDRFLIYDRRCGHQTSSNGNTTFTYYTTISLAGGRN